MPVAAPAPNPTARLGPVSRTLVAELNEALTRKAAVVCVDAHGHYTEFFERIGNALPDNVQLLAYRGSYLEFLPQLVQQTAGSGLRPTLLHAPGLNTTTIKGTPLLQLYAVSHGFDRALPPLIKNAAAGRVLSEDVDAFLAQGDVTLKSADAWMAARTAEAHDAFETTLG